MNQTYSAASLTDLIGNTPLVPVPSLTSADLHVFAKLESYNPGGSFYDRLALSRLQRADKAGLLSAGRPLLDATGSEFSVSLAMLAAASGHPLHCVTDSAVPRTRLQMLAAYGARLHIADSPEQRGDLVRELQSLDPNLLLLDGSNLPPEMSAPLVDELCADLGAAPDVLLLPFAAAELISASAARLRELHPAAILLTVSVSEAEQPATSHPHLSVAPHDSRLAAQELLRTESLLVGPETGAIADVVNRLSTLRPPDSDRPIRLVLVATDHGDRWLSWLQEDTRGRMDECHTLQR